jgi:hypothetical protein
VEKVIPSEEVAILKGLFHGGVWLRSVAIEARKSNKKV